MIEGNLVRLRALRAEDLDHHVRWRNDPEVVHWATGGHPRFGPVTRTAVERGFETMLGLDPADSRVFTVEDLADGTPIGMVDYRDLDPFAGGATVGITIGEKDFWGRGHGTEALRLLVGHLFDTCRLHRVELDTWGGNERAVHAFVKAGFREEGRRRDAVLVAGQWHDNVLFGMLREEWRESAGGRNGRP